MEGKGKGDWGGVENTTLFQRYKANNISKQKGIQNNSRLRQTILQSENAIHENSINDTWFIVIFFPEIWTRIL